jgi:hypothetical protein
MLRLAIAIVAEGDDVAPNKKESTTKEEVHQQQMKYSYSNLGN